MDYFRGTVVTTVDLIICGAAVVVLLIFTAIGFALVHSARTDLAALDQEVQSLTQQVAEARAIAERQDELADRIARVKAQVVDFEERLPTQREIPRLLDSFQEVASLSGIQYQRIVAEAPQEQPLYVKLPFTVNVRGRYPELGEFLKNLEFGERFIKVENLTIGEEDDGVSEATFSISTYTFVEEEA